VALTANATVADKEKCLSAGMNDYVKKPVRTRTLSHMLDKWVAHPVNKLDPAVLDQDPPMLFTGIRNNDIRSGNVPGQIEINSEHMAEQTFDISDTNFSAGPQKTPSLSAQKSQMANVVNESEPQLDDGSEVADETAAQTDSSCINVSAIDTIRSMQRPGKEDLLTKVVTVFSNRTPEVIEQMLVGANTSDTEAVSVGAHSLSSA